MFDPSGSREPIAAAEPASPWFIPPQAANDEYDLIYVVPDIHGRLDLLTDLMDLIGLDAKERRHRVVFLGDYIDRGPDSKGVLDFLMAGPQIRNQDWTCLMGNHEQMMLMSFMDMQALAGWMENGAGQTLVSFGMKDRQEVSCEIIRQMIDFRYAQWLVELPLYEESEHYVFVHAFVDPTLDLKDQNEIQMLWQRYNEGSSFGYRGKTVIHGHTPNAHGPLVYEQRIALDCGAVHSNRLVAAVCEGRKHVRFISASQSA